MLRIHFLDVKQGDSAIIEHNGCFGLIDCHRTPDGRNLALERLIALGATRLSFVCLTHPHKDHFKGMMEVLHHFRGQIGNFYSFQISDLIHNTRWLRKYRNKIIDVTSKMTSPSQTIINEEFLSILDFLSTDIDLDSVLPLNGFWNHFQPDGFQEAEFISLLPYAGYRGSFLTNLESGRFKGFDFSDDNKYSVAILVTYKGRRVLLGADALHEDWIRHQRLGQKDGRNIKSDVVKLPHHGSGYDNTAITMETFFKNSGRRIAIVSAGGKSHPDIEVLEWLIQNGIEPYCTNLCHHWHGSNIANFINTSGLTPELQSYIKGTSVTNDASLQPCQGTITVEIDNAGVINVATERNNSCPCRLSVVSSNAGQGIIAASQAPATASQTAMATNVSTS